MWRPRSARWPTCPNVIVKLGGLGMPLQRLRLPRAAEPPILERAGRGLRADFYVRIERFGAERCMFESNFPVDKVARRIGVLWNSFKRIAAGFSAAERAALFHDTAIRVYRLG